MGVRRKLVTLSLLVVALLTFSIIQAGAAITPGSKCSKAGLQSVYKNKIFTCLKFGSKLIWDNGVVFYYSNPTPSPAPTVTVTAIPSPGPTVTVTATPKPAPTVTVTASPKAIPTTLPAVTDLSANLDTDFLKFSFSRPASSIKIKSFELAAQYLLLPGSEMTKYSSYSDMKVLKVIKLLLQE